MAETAGLREDMAAGDRLAAMEEWMTAHAAEALATSENLAAYGTLDTEATAVDR